MKRTHIINLKSEIDIQTRLQVYKEALEEKSKVLKYGLCLGLPIILWGHEDHFGLTPIGMVWTHGHTPIAFPELTNDVIMYIDKHKENAEKLRLQFLSSAIKKIEKQLQVS